jgi:Fic family protein
LYIHELPDWPEFEWDAEVLAEILASVRHEQGRFTGRMESLNFRLRQEANLETLTQDLLSTSEIDGKALDPLRIRSLLSRHLGLESGGFVHADREMEGLVEMLLDASKNFKDALTEERLSSWHQSLSAPESSTGTSRNTGFWRDCNSDPMRVVSRVAGREKVHFQAPPAELLAGEMDSFLDWFEHGPEIDPVLKAGIAHLWFLTIHPFNHGNGRIARAISDLMLARSENLADRFYSMTAQMKAEKKEYFETLERTQKGPMDVTPWLQWYVGCLGRAIAGARIIQAAVLLKVRFWESLASTPINERQYKVLNILLEGFEGKLTTSKWAKLTGCSQDTAYRDILDLVESGVLSKDPSGGRSSSYSLAETD